MLMTIAAAGVRSSTAGSIISSRADAQYTIASIAMPVNHVEYASHLNQCRFSVSGSPRGPVRYFWLW